MRNPNASIDLGSVEQKPWGAIVKEQSLDSRTAPHFLILTK